MSGCSLPLRQGSLRQGGPRGWVSLGGEGPRVPGHCCGIVPGGKGCRAWTRGKRQVTEGETPASRRRRSAESRPCSSHSDALLISPREGLSPGNLSPSTGEGLI